jgi:hypothetical protein
VVVLDTVIQDDFARHRADELDAEAAYYRHRAIQEERALGPGYYVDLLRGMAADRAAMAQRIRTGNEAARDPARRRVPQTPSQIPVRNPSQLIDVLIGTYATTVAASASPGGGTPPATAPISTAST